ncbi:helix-turn-helix domain-containing protein [Xylella fastidiosa]|uniref:helix-turn-helix domain-containing protein n=1 Tax=Xylella fastidiosa TaxID=2371 RepID=UPI0021CCB344|nr:helix-turn-helix transcriptional regulator [Xylella fastidiosa]
METIGSRVRKEREAQNINRSDFAKKTGIGYSTIAELERGGMQTTTKLRLLLMRWAFLCDGWKQEKARKSKPQPPQNLLQQKKYRNIISVLNI